MTTHYPQLTRAQRYQIEAGLACGMTQVRIAKQLGVHPATVSREVRRNETQQAYKAVLADQPSELCQRSAHKFCKRKHCFMHIFQFGWSRILVPSKSLSA